MSLSPGLVGRRSRWCDNTEAWLISGSAEAGRGHPVMFDTSGSQIAGRDADPRVKGERGHSGAAAERWQ